MHENAEKTVEINRENLWTLILWATRYSCGRNTYALSLTIDIVLEHLRDLTPAERHKLVQELEVESRIRPSAQCAKEAGEGARKIRDASEKLEAAQHSATD